MCGSFSEKHIKFGGLSLKRNWLFQHNYYPKNEQVKYKYWKNHIIFNEDFFF